MWIAIGERTREIGICAPLACKRGGVLRMFLYDRCCSDSSAQAPARWRGRSLGAVKCGPHPRAALGAALSQSSVQLALHVGGLVRAALFITVVTTLAALYPAYRARD